MECPNRTTEGWTGKTGDANIEISETFNTARSNGLQIYADIMPTYPVIIRCELIPPGRYREVVAKYQKTQCNNSHE
jgi:hypothetical protein